MDRDEALAILSQHREDIRSFGVDWLAVFGSVARNEAGPDSDVDILVEFSQPIGLFGFVRLRRYLEQILGRSVDLATLDVIREPMRESVLRDAVRAA